MADICHFPGCDRISYDDCDVCKKPTCKPIHGKCVGDRFVCKDCVDKYS